MAHRFEVTLVIEGRDEMVPDIYRDARAYYHVLAHFFQKTVQGALEANHAVFGNLTVVEAEVHGPDGRCYTAHKCPSGAKGPKRGDKFVPLRKALKQVMRRAKRKAAR